MSKCKNNDTLKLTSFDLCQYGYVTHAKNKIIELNRKDYQPGRGMDWGKYIV